MNRKIILAVVAMSTVVFSACQQQKGKVVKQQFADSLTTSTIPDSTIYGVCGESTAMHNLEIISDAGDTLTYEMLDEGIDSTIVRGGLLAGDRMAVIAKQTTDGNVALKVINLTTLLGKWTSLDKNFEIQEGGIISSNIKAESKPWTSWKIWNGRLVLNKDTFDINNLGADSLYLENKEGIFAYKRSK
uniref:Lipocalin family protein n=1 Tax=Prevotella sp. GTC17254 TaxID=3236794 RepID=A0AB33IUX0_9BACT